MGAIATNVAQFIFPAAALALAMRRHVQVLERRKINRFGSLVNGTPSGEDDLNAEQGSSESLYLFGNLRVHYWIVHVFAVLTISSSSCSVTEPWLYPLRDDPM